MKYGYLMTPGNKEIFLETDAKIKSSKVVDAFINYFCNRRGHSDELRKRILTDERIRKQARYDMSKATYEFCATERGFEYHRIKFENGESHIPVSESDCIVFINEKGEVV